MPKRHLTGGGSDLKNQEKSIYYLSNFIKFISKKFLTEKRSKPSDRCTEKNIGTGVTLVNQKLIFAAYDKIGGVAPRVALFIQKLLFSAQKLRLVVLFIQKLLSSIQKLGSCAPYFARHMAAFFRKFSLRAAENGSILIEFAVCMPVLIILLFYIHDLVKIKRYYSQTEFVAQQMANILQNIAKTRAVTRNDIERAASLAYLTIYPGITMFSKKSGSPYHEFVHMPRCYVYYVKGLSDEKASCVWARWVNTSEYLSPKWNYNKFTSDSEYSIIRWGTNVTPSSIYPTLKVEAGQAKIILEAHLRWSPLLDTDTQGKKRNFSREVFGCYLVNPKFYATNAYFSSVVIFTPNSGFSETVPS